ncbi:hypothetical protein RKLH11_4324 [Rhodobacteraceae bacterium KLH11]|nr:hypothetical protein RKLH11_4324 [Rhodobacteraceae bacterium KLH11]
MAMKLIRTVVLTFVGFFLLALLSLWVVNLIPDAPIKENLLASSTPEHYPKHPYLKSVKLDEWTECVLLSSGLQRNPGQGPVSAADAWRDAVVSPVLGNCERLHSDESEYSYFRYWLGGQVIARPILYFHSVQAIRLVVFCAFVLSALAFVLTLLKRNGVWIAVGTGMLIATAPIYSQVFILPHASAWIIGFTAAAILVNSRAIGIERAVMVGLISGICLAFFDILNNPIVVPTALSLGYLLSCHAERKNPSVTNLLALNVVWFVGYAGFWSLKWALVMVQLGPDQVMEIVSGKVQERLGGETFGKDASLARSLDRNFGLMEKTAIPFVLVSLVAVAAKLIGAVRGRPAVNSSDTASKIVLLTIITGLLPIIWIAALRNHSIIHFWFVGAVLTWSLISWYIALLILTDVALRRFGVRKSDV